MSQAFDPSSTPTQPQPQVVSRSEVIFSLNGELIRAQASDAPLMLADFLRTRRNLPGTKIVCAEGDCGACTLLKAAPYRHSAKPQFLPVNSCIIPVASLDGAQLVTVDGLADQTTLRGQSNSSAPYERKGLHPAQEAMVKCHGSQCGFCTPGFVMALAGLVEKRLERGDTESPIEEKEAKNALTANLCRCTGYSPIIEAACSIDLKTCSPIRSRFENPALQEKLQKAILSPLHLRAEEFEYYAPTSLESAGAYLNQNPSAELISGATDLGVVHNKRKKRLKHLLSLHLIPELHQITRVGKSRLRIGAKVTLSEVRDFVKGELIPEFAQFLDLFASPQIKNQATLVGNLATASPIGDTPPFLLVAGTTVQAYSVSSSGQIQIREIPIESFFISYRKTALEPGELITSIEIDIPEKGEILRLQKVSQRKDLDISTVNVAFRLHLDPQTRKISKPRVAYGGVAATPKRISSVENLLQGKTPDTVDLDQLAEGLHSEITPIDDLRSSQAFRRVTAENILRHFIQELAQ